MGNDGHITLMLSCVYGYDVNSTINYYCCCNIIIKLVHNYTMALEFVHQVIILTKILMCKSSTRSVRKSNFYN